jgi:hypothetical protein
VPLGRLTTIIMPHKSGDLNLRSRNKKKTAKSQATNPDTLGKKISNFHSMTAIQILKHGLESNLHKKPGWLAKLLVAEGK